MEWKLVRGDYVPNGAGSMTALTGAEEVLQRVLFRLTARRGGMPFLPDLGSQLWTLLREKPSAWQALAGQYVVQALREEPDLTVDRVTLEQEEGRLLIDVYLTWQGQPLHAVLPLTQEGTYENGG